MERWGAIVMGLGVLVAAALLLLLSLTLWVAPRFRIWPTPGEKTWQSYVWWPLFRGLNVLCFAAAALDGSPGLGLPISLRSLAGLVLVGAVALFVYAFRVLGRDNSYGAQDGLVTGGIYQWTRNPQNALLIVVYACLALTADAGYVYVLCAAMMAVYALMVFCEEPWLERIYGAAYRSYCGEVPRFFHWRRAGQWLSGRRTS